MPGKIDAPGGPIAPSEAPRSGALRSDPAGDVPEDVPEDVPGEMPEDMLDRLAAELEAGRIGPDEAVARLIEHGVLTHLPGGTAEADTLRAMLRSLIEDDPYLSGLVEAIRTEGDREP